MDTVCQVIFVLAYWSLWVWQVQCDTNMVKWFSDLTEAQKQAMCFPNQAWHSVEPAQVGLGCVPRTRSEGSMVRKWRVSLSTELAQVQQGSLASIQCQPSWMCTKSCFRASANKPSQSSERGLEASELAEAQLSSTWITCHYSVSHPLIPWVIQLTILSSKQRIYRTVTQAILLWGYEMLVIYRR